MRPIVMLATLVLGAELVLAPGCAQRPKPAPPAPSSPAPVPVGTPIPSAGDTTYDRASHVYPEGESAIARKLLDAIPDPEKVTATPAPDRAPSSPPIASGCWEVQLLSTTDSDLARRVRQDGADRLSVPVRIVEHAGFQKVRAGECLSSSAALALAERARSEGFSGAFRAPSLP